MASDVDNILSGVQWGVGGACAGGAVGLGADVATQGNGLMMPTGMAAGGAGGYALGSGIISAFILAAFVIILAILLLSNRDTAVSEKDTCDFLE
jgi:hypothetical protein